MLYIAAFGVGTVAAMTMFAAAVGSIAIRGIHGPRAVPRDDDRGCAAGDCGWWRVAYSAEV